ncbi:MAG: hypothetical protein ACPGRY_16755 [Candidatus Latescibacterota bacterium]
MALPLQLGQLTRGGVGGHSAYVLWPFYFAPDAGINRWFTPTASGFTFWAMRFQIL